MIFRKSLIFILPFLVFISCKSDQTKKQDIEATDLMVKFTGDTTERHQIYLVTVDNLRARASEDKKSEVIEKLSEGIAVTSNGMQSEIYEKVILRGVEYNEPYRKITFKDKDMWVYGGGLQKIYDNQEPSDFTSTFDNLVLRFANLKKEGLSQGEEIIDILRKNGGGSATWNDVLYNLGSFYMQKLEKEGNIHEPLEGLQWTADEYKSAHEQSFDMNSSKIAKQFSRAGFKFDASEGIIYPILDLLVLKAAIRGPFSDEMSEYLNLEIFEGMTKMFSDGGIVCPISTLVDHAVNMEKFIAANPKFVNNDKIIKKLEYMHYCIQYGSSNSPSVDYQSKSLNPEWMTAWKQYQKLLPNGKIAPALTQLIKKYSKS